MEKFVLFTKELAVMVARGMNGDGKAYPVVETIHKNNICHTVIAPAPVDAEVHDQAKELAIRVMEKMEGAGVFGIEMFLVENTDHPLPLLQKEGDTSSLVKRGKGEIRVLINEIAPRVHNSGHYTIEACATNQFAQHIRAVTGLPLGLTHMMVPAAVMVNLLGERQANARVKGLEKALVLPQVGVHIYNKLQTKPERKMGHVTAVDRDPVGVKTARENIALNACGNTVEAEVSDLLQNVRPQKASLIVANIIADIIIRLTGNVGAYLADGGIYITSGIIASREEEVAESLLASGFEILDTKEMGEWRAIACRKKV